MCDAILIHNDIVTKRLQLVEGDTFQYHVTNDCYKKYAMKSFLKRKAQKNEDQSRDQSTKKNESDERGVRFKAVHNEPNIDTTPRAMRDMNCIICGNISFKKQLKVFRISESDHALKFLAVSNFFQDDVFTRTCDLQDAASVFGADLYYHNECMTKYLYKYDSCC